MDLAKLGVRSTLCGKVGDDVFGRFVAETLVSPRRRRAGLEGRSPARDQPDPDRQRPGPGPPLHPLLRRQQGPHGRRPRRPAALDPPPRVLYVGGYLVLPGLDADALADRFAEAAPAGHHHDPRRGRPPGPGDYLRHSQGRPARDRRLPAQHRRGRPDPRRARPGPPGHAFRDLGARRVVITRGEHGSIAVSDTFSARLGTYPIPFVDGSGGGDAFDAGYIAGLLDGRDELGCLKLASAIGASCVRAVGTTAGIFTRAEADAFLASHELAVEAF